MVFIIKDFIQSDQKHYSNKLLRVDVLFIFIDLQDVRRL